MGCSPSQHDEEILKIKKERVLSNKVTVASSRDPLVVPDIINQISISLFIIGEENSRYEESGIPSNVGTILTPQLTETNNRE